MVRTCFRFGLMVLCMELNLPLYRLANYPIPTGEVSALHERVRVRFQAYQCVLQCVKGKEDASTSSTRISRQAV